MTFVLPQYDRLRCLDVYKLKISWPLAIFKLLFRPHETVRQTAVRNDPEEAGIVLVLHDFCIIHPMYI